MRIEEDFSLEDFSLMEGAKTMDREALIAIFDRFAAPLYNFAMRLCGDPIKADQAVGDVFCGSNLKDLLITMSPILTGGGGLTRSPRLRRYGDANTIT